ncbi:MAG: Uma2 family endonuclease [Verrucomicrobiae bacterium]|nr:Uma2 family endonuclease [Verrucomicrobiae bacterium]
MAIVSYRPHYTVEDYLGWEGDWELWDGIPVAMSPAPNFFHQTIGSRLVAALVNQLGQSNCPASCQAAYESDWHVDATTVVRPDVLITCEAPEGNWLTKRPEFIAEILSPSTREKDLVAKRELYAANGVPYYLILDPENRSALMLSLDDEGTYREQSPEEAFEIHPGCELRLQVAPLFA